MLESLNLVLVVGLAVDYVVHLAEGYARSEHNDRLGRVHDALEEVGISVLSGAITTLGSSFFLLLARILFFKQFGIFMFATIGLSLFYALGLFIVMLGLIGPQNDTGKLTAIFRKCCGRGSQTRQPSSPVRAININLNNSVEPGYTAGVKQESNGVNGAVSGSPEHAANGGVANSTANVNQNNANGYIPGYVSTVHVNDDGSGEITHGGRGKGGGEVIDEGFVSRVSVKEDGTGQRSGGAVSDGNVSRVSVRHGTVRDGITSNGKTSNGNVLELQAFEPVTISFDK